VSVLRLDSASASPWGSPLLEDISVSLDPGRVLGLAGPNGAGKSSLLRLIAGDIPLSDGKLLLDGKSRADWQARPLARKLAYLPQLSLLNFPYTVEEVVALGRMPHDTGLAVDEEIFDQVMAATDITGLRGRLYTRLSGGEKQRVQLARVFAQIWDAGVGGLLLLDEPTTALDLSHQQLVAAAVRQLAQTGCAVALAIHDLNLVAGLADTIAVLDKGRIAACGAPREIFTEALFRDVFSIDVLISQHPGRDQLLVISR
jgi:iron complex transport system ATP-binding protein